MHFPHSILREEAGGGAAAGGAGAGAAGAGAGAAAGTSGGASGAGAGSSAGAPAPKPFYDGFYGTDGKIDKTAFDRLPDHLKGHKDVFAKYETFDALLAGFGNVHTLAMKKAMAPLPENAPPEVLAERKAHLDTINNVPKDPKGYGIAKPQDLDAMFWNEESAGKFAQLAQKHSISPAAVKELLALQLETTRGEISKGQQMESDYYAKQNGAFADTVTKLGMDPEKAADLAKRGAISLGIDEKDPVMKNAAVRLAAMRHASLVGEDKLITGDAGASGQGTELQQARDIINNPQNPLHKAYFDSTDPRNEAAKQKVNELYRIDGERKRRRGENV